MRDMEEFLNREIKRVRNRLDTVLTGRITECNARKIQVKAAELQGGIDAYEKTLGYLRESARAELNI